MLEKIVKFSTTKNLFCLFNSCSLSDLELKVYFDPWPLRAHALFSFLKRYDISTFASKGSCFHFNSQRMGGKGYILCDQSKINDFRLFLIRYHLVHRIPVARQLS